jgi:hypothetical protein
LKPLSVSFLGFKGTSNSDEGSILKNKRKWIMAKIKFTNFCILALLSVGSSAFASVDSVTLERWTQIISDKNLIRYVETFPIGIIVCNMPTIEELERSPKTISWKTKNDGEPWTYTIYVDCYENCGGWNCGNHLLVAEGIVSDTSNAITEYKGLDPFER